MTEKASSITTVCFTGHRDIEVSSAYLLPSALKRSIRQMISRGARRFLAGGAMGFDTLAALCVLEMKNEFPDISLELILPCRNQSQKWDERNKKVYETVISHADRVEYLYETYNSTCMHDRNRRLIDLSDVVVAYLDHSGGGTDYTVSYAVKEGREIINLCGNL
ncbi:MAG: DUF1273 family protein [Clostridia bacterium]|nr:DUF1273 family protein [Clostridia bacterium]